MQAADPALAMPAEDRIRFDDDQTPAPPGKQLAAKDPEAAIYIPELWSGLMSFENKQLLPKSEVPGDQSCAGLENGRECVSKAPNHQKVPSVILINRVRSIALLAILGLDRVFASYRVNRLQGCDRNRGPAAPAVGR